LSYSALVKIDAQNMCRLFLMTHCARGAAYGEEPAQTVLTPLPRAVRRAEPFMIDNAGSPITVSDVADHLDISLRSLQAGPPQLHSCGGLDWSLCTTSFCVRAREPT
jgi:hypothetical protein